MPVFSSGPCLPDDLEPDHPGSPFLVHGCLLDHIPEDLLALRSRGRGCVPHFGEICPQGEDVPAVRGAEVYPLFTEPALVLLLRFLRGSQLLLPRSLDVASHQSIPRLYDVRLPTSSVRFILESLQVQLALVS